LRGVSQLVVAVALVGLVLASAAAASIVVANLARAYSPRLVVLALASPPQVEVSSASSSSGYTVVVKADISNQGTYPATLVGGPGASYSVVVFIGPNRVYVARCPLQATVSLSPGETKAVSFTCQLSTQDLSNVFGGWAAFEAVPRSAYYLYTVVYVSLPGGGGGEVPNPCLLTGGGGGCRLFM